MKPLSSLAILVTIVLGLAAATAAQAKPAAPARFEGMLAQFTQMDNAAEKLRWSEAAAHLQQLTDTFKQVLPAIREHVERNVAVDFIALVGNVKKAIDHQDLDYALRSSLLLKRLFVQIMEAFEFRVHPMWAVIFADIDKALAAAEQREFHQIAAEMSEVLTWIRLGAFRILEAKGVDRFKLEDFRSHVESAKAGAVLRDADGAVSALARLRSMSVEFTELFG